MDIDLNYDADLHLEFFDSPDDRHVFQVFGDVRRSGVKAAWRFGTYAQHREWLWTAQEAGAGIFVMVQRGRSRRSGSTIERARCLFFDFDGIPPRLPKGIVPSLLLRTSPGKYHAYLKIVPTFDIDAWHLTQIGMQRDCGSDPKCNDPKRVARLAGFLHQKEAPHRVEIVDYRPWMVYSLEEFREFKVEPDPIVLSSDVLDFRAKGMAWDFPLRRSVLKRALAKLRAARAPVGRQAGNRSNTLVEVATHLGSCATLGVDPKLATDGMTKIVLTWEGRDRSEDLKTIRHMFERGFRRGIRTPPFTPDQQKATWARQEGAQRYLDELRNTVLEECTSATWIMGAMPEWQDAFVSERKATIAINRVLRERGYVEERTSRRRQYVLKAVP